MNKTNRRITFKGNKLTIIGKAVRENARLPKFKLTGIDLKDITERDFQGKVILISVIPSLDTPVCALSTKRFNQELSGTAGDVIALIVSMDLPFAQSRWAQENGTAGVVMASDYKYRKFGLAFGALIKELGLLTRSIFIADRLHKVIHVEYVQEITNEPDYGAALSALKRVLEA